MKPANLTRFWNRMLPVLAFSWMLLVYANDDPPWRPLRLLQRFQPGFEYLVPPLIFWALGHLVLWARRALYED